MAKRFDFTVRYQGNLDMIPGAMHDETDWHRLAIGEFIRQSHYETSATIVSTTDQHDILRGWKNMTDGWVEVTGWDMPDELKDSSEELQFKTGEQPHGFKDWVAANDPGVWCKERTRSESLRITHYRKAAPVQSIPLTEVSGPTYSEMCLLLISSGQGHLLYEAEFEGRTAIVAPIADGVNIIPPKGWHKEGN